MKKYTFTGLALFLCVSRLAVAQLEMQPPPDNRATTVTSVMMDMPEGVIKLDVLVTDATGNPISGLSADDFGLLENGHLQNVLSFRAFDGRGGSTEPPVKIIILIDTVALPESLAREERLAVTSYLRRNGGRLEHPFSVFWLADSGLWTVAPSEDGNVLAREIERSNFTLVRHNAGWQSSSPLQGLKDSPSESALKALGLIACDERKKPGRKLLLWVGPGWGVGSGGYAEKVQGSPPPFNTVWWFSALLREAHLALYSFTVGETDPHAQLYKAYLAGVSEPRKASFMNVYRKVLAVQSGGRVVDDGFDLVGEIESCIRDAGPFYRISFDPLAADHPNEYHDLKVVVKRQELTARTNTGYYDQPYYSIDPIPPPRRVSIEQLEQLLAAARGGPDEELAKQLSELALTERLSEQRLSQLDGEEYGKRSRSELRILADSSADLDPPANEILTDAPPDAKTQQHLLSLTSAYLDTTIHKLPDLSASRTTVRYQETPMYLEAGTSENYQPLHVTDRSTTIVRYRHGYEIAETNLPKRKLNDPELITYGIFDAIEIDEGLTWSHWEQGAHDRVAVFQYSISSGKSLHQVWLCCLPDGDGKQAFLRYAGFHEEIGVDPESGAILRFRLHADLKSTTPIARSEIMIDYGPVEIGGRTYICPQRSISIMRARSVRVLSNFDDAFMAYGPYVTMLNDISFDHYHIFRSEAHVLTGIAPSER